MKKSRALAIKRVYDPPESTDGVRILVDRLWPRGLSKDKAKVDLWLKDIAPSDRLRRWFAHDPKKWTKFLRDYFRELGEKDEAIKLVAEKAAAEKVTLLYGAKEDEFNNAVALRSYLAAKTKKAK